MIHFHLKCDPVLILACNLWYAFYHSSSWHRQLQKSTMMCNGLFGAVANEQVILFRFMHQRAFLSSVIFRYQSACLMSWKGKGNENLHPASKCGTRNQTSLTYELDMRRGCKRTNGRTMEHSVSSCGLIRHVQHYMYTDKQILRYVLYMLKNLIAVTGQCANLHYLVVTGTRKTRRKIQRDYKHLYCPVLKGIIYFLLS